MSEDLKKQPQQLENFVNILRAIHDIDTTTCILTNLKKIKAFKNGLLQQMFV
jgi:hypothetical protein